MRDRISIAARSPMSASRVTRALDRNPVKEMCGRPYGEGRSSSGGGGGGTDRERRATNAMIATTAIARTMTPTTTTPRSRKLPVPSGETVMLPHIVLTSEPRSLRYRKVPVHFVTVKFQRTGVLEGPKGLDRGSTASRWELLS